MKVPLLLASVVLFNLTCFARDSISITQNKSGKTIEVTPLVVTAVEATFQYNGKQFTLLLDHLDGESRTKLERWAKSQTEAAGKTSDKINEAIGHQLFKADNSLWTEEASEVAGRLQWKRESLTKDSSSFRYYPRPSYGFVNARPYCCTLYGGAEGKTSNLSIVFANKGDYGSNVGKGEDHFKPKGELPTPKSLDEAIQRDIKAISASLTEALGEPTQQRYGEKEDRRMADRWDYGEHSFILSQREEEYAHMLIVPRETADLEGKVKFVKDQELRRLLSDNITRKNNGDIFIDNIPMVDQGPKGYCAPATFERAMRYMLVPADMYLLATLATKQGGGTNTRLLAEEAKRIIRSKARRIKDLSLEDDLSIRQISRYIDKGVPILWQMASLKKYNDAANIFSEKRQSVEDFSKWASTIAKAAEELAPDLHNTDKHHICMIIGYNEKTLEIAVSDSWGPRYALRWIHIDIAKAVTSRGGFVIDL
jgi:hypothetical protein